MNDHAITNSCGRLSGHELGHPVLLVDFRGGGGSSGDDTTIGVREADDVALALDYARNRWPGRPLVLYGRSMGAAAVLRAVGVLGVRPQALIVECPFDRLVHTVGNRFVSMGLPAFPFAPLLVFWGGVQMGFDGFGHNPAEYAAGVHCPVLQMHGAHDPRVTTAEARAVFAALAGEKEFVLFENIGHQAYEAQEPAGWKRAVGGFLRNYGRGAAR